MEKLGKIMDRLIKWIVYILFTLMIVFLTGVSIFGSCYVNTDEYTYFVSDKPILHVVAILVFFILCFLGRKYGEGKITEKWKNIFWKILLLGYTIGIAVIAIYVSMEPRADQKSVTDTALAMIQGDFSAFQKGGYMDVYPNQVGIVYLFYWLFKIFPFGYQTICVLNAISLAVIFIGMAGIGKIILGKEKKYIGGIVTLLFFPLSCYVTFIYGNLIGMALSTLGIYFTLLYFKDRQTKWIIIAIVTSALAVVVKENYLIPLIGIVIFVLLDFIHTPNKKTIGFFFGLLIMTICSTNVAKIHIQHMTGEKISSGVPTLAWVAMGMQEGYMAYGWHNQYNENVYRENNCDTKLANAKVKEEIGTRVQEFIKNPSYAIKFFYQKTISQWNNPTFEGFWINDIKKREENGLQVKTLSGVLDSIAGEPGNKWLTLYCNFFQTILLIGVCMWLLLGRKELQIEQLLLATIFIGGFIFHFVWEAKCQYVLPYFVLLIPYAIKGFQLLLNQIENVIRKDNGTMIEKSKKNRGVILLVLGMVCVVLLSLIGQKYIDKAVGFSNEAYENYLKQ